MTVNKKSYIISDFCEREILRYAACREADSKILALLNECISEVRDCLSYKVCWTEVNANIKDGICDFGIFKVKSYKLYDNLSGCKRVIIFAATIGTGIDRLILKYSRISPAKALLFQTIGAERIEALCDTFCKDIKKEADISLKPRFSPGYGDLPLGVQKDIITVLNTEKNIGLYLNESLIMSPTKSVTAFAGVTDNEVKKESDCKTCRKQDCIFRGAV